MSAASEAAGVSKRTGFKWLARFKAEGAAGLADRSSRPKRSPRALTAQEQAQLEDLRRRHWPLWRIAEQAGCGVATASRCMKRLGLSRLMSLEPAQPVVRQERAAAGELLRLDTKKLMHIDGIGHRITGDRRTTKHGIGWQMVQLAIDVHSRVSFAQVLPDNGAGNKNTFKAACEELGIRHIKTRPYTPKTNGKAERFVQTSLREWAYAQPYVSSAQPSPRPLCSPSCIATTGIGHTPP